MMTSARLGFALYSHVHEAAIPKEREAFSQLLAPRYLKPLKPLRGSFSKDWCVNLRGPFAKRLGLLLLTGSQNGVLIMGRAIRGIPLQPKGGCFRGLGALQKWLVPLSPENKTPKVLRGILSKTHKYEIRRTRAAS